jgi:ribosomal protein RSM22 (predicted rRNA methylase)
MRAFLCFFVLCLTLISCTERQSFLINGKVSSKLQVKKLNRSEIFSYEKWRPQEEQSEHPIKGNEATIIAVTTKAAESESQKERQSLLNLILDLAKEGKEILIVQDGIIISSSAYESLRKAPNNQLSSAFLMPEKEAKEHYGSYAKPITLVINTYHPIQ